MNAPRFHVEHSIGASRIGETIRLPDRAAHHATRVLRMAPGDALVLFDGTGGEYRARIVHADKRGTSVELERFDAVEREAPHAVVLAQSVLATDAMDNAIRKAVELGAAAIVPVLADRSQRMGERGGRRQQHWQSIAIAACEQCGRNRVPSVEEAASIDAYFAKPRESLAMPAPGSAESLASLCARSIPREVLIGPEGGFTAREIDLARDRGAALVHLGARVLRADTAAIAALATIAAIAGDAR